MTKLLNKIIPVVSNYASAIKILTMLIFGLIIYLDQLSLAHAQKTGASGLPLPRFVSLKAKRVNMRVGPGRDYQVQWLYIRKGLPIEIIQEFGNWRKVRDPNGNEGWMLHSLLSGKRKVIVTPWDVPAKKTEEPLPTTPMRSNDSENSGVVAQIEAGAIANVSECTKTWCRLNMKAGPDNTNLEGYVKQTLLWGVYPDEKLEN